jgi:hypothetical protein
MTKLLSNFQTLINTILKSLFRVLSKFNIQTLITLYFKLHLFYFINQ